MGGFNTKPSCENNPKEPVFIQNLNLKTEVLENTSENHKPNGRGIDDDDTEMEKNRVLPTFVMGTTFAYALMPKPVNHVVEEFADGISSQLQMDVRSFTRRFCLLSDCMVVTHFCILIYLLVYLSGISKLGHCSTRPFYLDERRMLEGNSFFVLVELLFVMGGNALLEPHSGLPLFFLQRISAHLVLLIFNVYLVVKLKKKKNGKPYEVIV